MLQQRDALGSAASHVARLSGHDYVSSYVSDSFKVVLKHQKQQQESVLAHGTEDYWLIAGRDFGGLGRLTTIALGGTMHHSPSERRRICCFSVFSS